VRLSWYNHSLSCLWRLGDNSSLKYIIGFRAPDQKGQDVAELERCTTPNYRGKHWIDGRPSQYQSSVFSVPIYSEIFFHLRATCRPPFLDMYPQSQFLKTRICPKGHKTNWLTRVKSTPDIPFYIKPIDTEATVGWLTTPELRGSARAIICCCWRYRTLGYSPQLALVYTWLGNQSVWNFTQPWPIDCITCTCK